jgi:hypothetical protein
LAVLVAAALTLLSAAASGVESLPENSGAPTISPSTPIEGKTETATQGTWSGSPTSFAYAWYRCSGTATCVSIPSATSSTYAPTSSDLQKTLRVVVTAANTKGSASAISSATSAAKFPPPPYYWNAASVKIPAATPKAFSAASLTSFVWKTTIFGGTISITCTSQASVGTIENPSESKTGIVSGMTFELSGCAISEPAGCKLSGTTITFETIKGTAVEFGEKSMAVKFEPTGSKFVTLKISECAIAGSYAYAGSFRGIDNPSSSSLEFTAASSEGFNVGGNPATLEGTTKIQTTTGESLKLTP